MEKPNELESPAISPRELPRYELEEQLRFYKSELDKRDELIRDLTKLTTSCPTNANQRPFCDKVESNEKLEEIRSRVEKLQLTLAENRDIIHEKNSVICELRAENETIRLDCVTHIQRIEELEQLLEEKIGHLNSFKTAEEQHDLVLRALQQDVKTKNAKLLDLRSQIRLTEQKYTENLKHLEENCNMLKSVMEDFATLLDCESVPEQCLVKLAELLKSHSLYKTQATQKTDQIESYEFEQRAARETVLRLSGELNKEQQEKEAAEVLVQSLKLELQKLKGTCEQAEAHNHLLEDRIKQLTEALHSARTEMEQSMRKLTLVTETEAKCRTQRPTSDIVSSDKASTTGDVDGETTVTLDDFLQNVTTWFEIPKCTQTSEVLAIVLDRIQEMEDHMKLCSTETQAATDELKILRSNEREYNLIKTRLQERIDGLERQRASDGTLIDNLRAERNQLHDLICKLALATKFEDAVNELAVDILGETLLARITQLQQGDTEKQAKQRLQITRLQRDLKESKERVDSLELQLSIMRRRLAEMHENRTTVVTPASQTPATLAASEKERRRIAKQLQQTREDADKLREEIVLLKARLLESSRDKLANIRQAKSLRSYETRINELKRVGDEQKEEARKARIELEHLRMRYKTEVEKMEQAHGDLEMELRRTKEALDASHRSEEQLLDFRVMVARHLGLDNEHLAVPDYEILVHLDRLVAANQAHMANVVATERALAIMQGNNN